jgi:hypothetical protein
MPVRIGVLVGCAWLGLGCAPTVSSFTPAHVAPKHHVQAEAGFDVSVPVTGVAGLWDQVDNLAEAAGTRELSDEEQRRLFRGAAGLALNPPSASGHVGLGYTVIDALELNGRLMTGAWRLGGRYQVLRQADHAVDGTFSLGGGHYSYEFPLSDQIPFIRLENFSRWQLDAGFLVGKHADWYRWWVGPKLLFTTYGTELVFEHPIPGAGGGNTQVLASLDGVGAYVGGQLGMAVGYKHVFAAFELTYAKFWTNAKLELLSERHDTNLQTSIVSPGFALLFEF